MSGNLPILMLAHKFFNDWQDVSPAGNVPVTPAPVKSLQSQRDAICDLPARWGHRHQQQPGQFHAQWEPEQASHRLQTSSCVVSAERCRDHKDKLSAASRQQHQGQAIELI